MSIVGWCTTAKVSQKVGAVLDYAEYETRKGMSISRDFLGQILPISKGAHL